MHAEAKENRRRVGHDRRNPCENKSEDENDGARCTDTPDERGTHRKRSFDAELRVTPKRGHEGAGAL